MKNNSVKLKTFKFLIVIFSFSFLVFNLTPVAAQVIGDREFLKGLVPCGTSYAQTPCTICHFYKLLQNIINFLLVTSSALIVLMATYIAFLFLFSGGNPKNIQDARSKLWLLVWGTIWVLGSWLVLNTIINFVSIIGKSDAFPLPWNQISCEVVIADNTTNNVNNNNTNTNNTVNPTEEQAMAQVIRDQNTCGGTASCGGVNSCSTINAVASGNPPPVCFSGCNSSSVCPPNPNVHLSGSMLRTLDAMNLEGLKYKITSLTTGSHSTNSLHYQGRAVDLIKDGSTTYVQLEQRLNALSSALFVQCENSGGVKVSCSSGSVGHIHAEFPK